MRKNDIIEYLKEAESLIEYIREEKEQVEEKRESQKLFAAKVTSCVNLLRICLEYCSQDIYEMILSSTDGLTVEARKRKNKYFPYGKTENDFKSMVGSSLPQLKVKDITVYNILESIQPHICLDMWLYNLCSISNEAKHNMANQDRTDKDYVNVNNSFKIRGASIVVKAGGSVFGKKTEEDVRIGLDTTEEEMKKYNFKVVKLKYSHFTFKETGESIFDSLQKWHRSVADFYQRLYLHLEK